MPTGGPGWPIGSQRDSSRRPSRAWSCRYSGSTPGGAPTKSRTYFNEDLIVVVLQGTFTPAERSLVANGKGDVVLSGRRALQDIMRGDLIAGIEDLTGRTVLAFLSDNSIEPDVKVKSFLLAPQTTLAAG